MQRQPVLDVLRGFLLVMMTMTHLPTVWSSSLGQPFGFISAAEGFVFLSAFLAGKIFIERQQVLGTAAATQWMFGRAFRLYLLHLALLVLAFTVVAWIATTFERPAARNLLHFYLQSPHRAALGAAVLAYQPPLLDILPMYILFLVATPAVMGVTARHGWATVLAASVTIWVAAQFGLRRFMYGLVSHLVGWDIPMAEAGAFDLFAWQFLWVLGLWFGALGFGHARQVLASGAGVLHLALVTACAMLFWRHYSGPMGFEDSARHLFWIDKWTLSPVRIVNLAALVLVFVGFGAGLMNRIRLPGLELLGRASLWVFVAHIATALVLLCLVGGDDQPLSGWIGLSALAIGYGALFAVAAAARNLRARG
jgi:hypothetical protein